MSYMKLLKPTKCKHMSEPPFMQLSMTSVLAHVV